MSLIILVLTVLAFALILLGKFGQSKFDALWTGIFLLALIHLLSVLSIHVH